MLQLVPPESNRGHTQTLLGQHNHQRQNVANHNTFLVGKDRVGKGERGWVSKFFISLDEDELTIAAKKSFSKASTVDLER